MRTYYEVVTDLVSILHLQGGDMIGFNKCPAGECTSSDGYVRMLDDFKMGPNLVRGFEPAGLGPRDITPGTSNDNIGGTMYWGASLEFQYPFYFLPKDAGFRGAVFVDSRIGVGLQGRNACRRPREKSTAQLSTCIAADSIRLSMRDAVCR